MGARPVARYLRIFVVFLVAVSGLYIYLNPSQRPYSPDYGRLSSLDHTSRFAIVTFLGSDTSQRQEDDYFVACRILTYQVLHAQQTRLRDENMEKIDFIVAVTSEVDPWKREQLQVDGAKVVEIEDLPLRWWIRTGVTRWKDQFTKLRLLQLTQYSRVLFLDADTLLLSPLDDIFNSDASRNPSQTNFTYRKGDEADLPAEYVFMASSDHQFTGERDHPVPPDPAKTTGSFSAGFWLAAPSQEVFEYLLSVMGHYRRFDPHTMEQSLLNYAFRRCDVSQKARESSSECPENAKPGPMPWKELDWKWSSTWPSSRDVENGVVSLHEKLWKTGPQPLRDLWGKWRSEMEATLGPVSH